MASTHTSVRQPEPDPRPMHTEREVLAAEEHLDAQRHPEGAPYPYYLDPHDGWVVSQTYLNWVRRNR